MPRARFSLSIILVILLGLMALAGCGGNQEERQAYVDDMLIALGERYQQVEPISLNLYACLSRVQGTAPLSQPQSEEERQQQNEEERKATVPTTTPEGPPSKRTTQEEVERARQVTRQGWENVERFISSGYTDVLAAQNASRYFDELIRGEQEAIQSLKQARVPDQDTERINDECLQGLQKCQDADVRINDALKMVSQQSVEQRAQAAAALAPLKSTYDEALKMLISSVDNTIRYTQDNALQGETDLLLWKGLLTEEQQSVSAFK